MTTRIFFYSGSGNSLWAARRLAENLGNATTHPMPRVTGPVEPGQDEAIGLVFPVHMWGIPRAALRMIDLLPRDSSIYYFAVAVNAGQVASTLLQLRDVMGKKGMTLGAGYSLVTPTNYIPWGGPGPEEKWRKTLLAAEEKLSRIAVDASARRVAPVEKGPLWQRVLLSPLYRLAFPHVPGMDAGFFSDERCTSCGICAKVCPARNIVMEAGKPSWLHRCEQCMACIQWCPAGAIQYGKKTRRYARYHHPETVLADMIGHAPE